MRTFYVTSGARGVLERVFEVDAEVTRLFYKLSHIKPADARLKDHPKPDFHPALDRRGNLNSRPLATNQEDS
ncbi:hypothetical protein EVAR_36282_1 [Eumeta japonica]|uniref:Uncharacterized protein n=1 Tax=Eumeta variegata TaxID=151549 RepID=A0A4C1VIC1_EUMVA|nr:hypothetical protein EVAR_36282_1 [Eumeta japonica]